MMSLSAQSLDCVAAAVPLDGASVPDLLANEFLEILTPFAAFVLGWVVFQSTFAAHRATGAFGRGTRRSMTALGLPTLDEGSAARSEPAGLHVGKEGQDNMPEGSAGGMGGSGGMPFAFAAACRAERPQVQPGAQA